MFKIIFANLQEGRGFVKKKELEEGNNNSNLQRKAKSERLTYGLYSDFQNALTCFFYAG